MFRPRRSYVIGLAAALALLALTSVLPAQDLSRLDTSLKWIPADAASYNSMLRNREQWDAVVKSRAWARLTSLPLAKMGWQKIEEEWNNPFGGLAIVKELYKDQENRQLVEFFKEMVSEEIFTYTGKTAPEFGNLLNELYMVNQFGPLAMLAKGMPPRGPEAGLAMALRTLAKNPERLKAPDVLIGFKVKTPKAAQDQLKRLEALWNLVAQKIPPLEGRLKKSAINGGQFFSFRFDGKLVPWDQIPIRNLEENPGEFNQLMKRLQEIQLTLSIGIRENYLLISLGEGTAAIEALDKGPRLIDRPEFKKLASFADKRLTSISYVSKESLNPGKNDPEASVKWFMDLLKESGLNAQQQIKLGKDFRALMADVAKYTPEPGAHLSFSFLSERGVEGYDFNWTKNHGLDGSRPLTILENLGGNPLAFFASRNKVAVEDYNLLVKWLKIGHQHVEDIVIPQIPPQDAQQYQVVFKLVQPFLARLDKTTGQKLIPSLADGQGALILDAKLTSNQWHKQMPFSAKALPMVEPAVVLGVSDAELFKQAAGEYRDLANDAIGLLAKFNPGGPDFKIPPPKTRIVPGGTLYSYPFPDMLELDAKIQPTAGVGQKVAVFGISQNHAERLLAPTRLKIDSMPLANPNKSLAAAAYFDWAGLLQSAQPWLDFAMQEGRAPQEIQVQIRDVLQILQCLRSYSSATYLEDGVIVTHSETVVRDLDR